MPNKKHGPISHDDRKYIIDNMDEKSPEEIAKTLNKSPKVIEKEIKNYIDLPVADNTGVRWHLKKMPEWKHLKLEFASDELNLIEDKYVKYIEQMEDVTATEESQILNMIKLEILMDRNLKGRMDLLNSARTYEALKQEILNGVDGDFSLLTEQDRQRIMDIEDKKNANSNVETNRTRQYVELQQELNNISTKLKVSRNERIDKVMDSKVTFNHWVKELMDLDKQREQSRIIQLYGLAVDKEFNRLSKPHKYADNMYDNPILTSDVLDTLEKEDKSQEEIDHEKKEPVT